MLQKFPLLVLGIQLFILPTLLFLLYKLTPGFIVLPFLIFTLCALNLGLGLTKYFNPLLKLEGIVQKTTFSIFIGMIAYTLIILTWAQFGGRIDLTILSVFYALINLANLFYLKNSLIEYRRLFALSNLSGIDLISYFGFSIIFGLSLLTILNYYYFQYDSFTFWVSDAKLIYLTKYLRNEYNINNSVNYTSFFPLHSVYLFELFGSLKEQYAAFITILYAAITSLFIYSIASKQNQKFIVSIILFYVLGTFVYTENLMFTTYAEVVVSSVVLFSIFYILRPIDQQQVNKKILLTIILLISLFFIKYLNFYYSIIIFGAWMLLDGKQILSYLSEKRKIHLLSSLSYLAPLVILGSYFWYFNTTWRMPYEGQENSVLAPFFNTGLYYYTSIDKFIEYVDALLQLIITKYNWLLFIFVTGILFPFFSKSKITKSQLILILLLIALPSINIFAYLIYPRDLLNMSLVRYLTPIIFCVPLIWIYNKPTLKIKAGIKSLILTLILVGYITIFISRNKIDFTFHNGEYRSSSEMQMYSNLADEIITKHLKQGEKVLIVNNHSGNSLNEQGDKKSFLTNIDIFSRKLGYFIFEHNASGSYIVQIEDFDKYIKDNKIEKTIFIFEKTHNSEWLSKFGLQGIEDGKYLIAVAKTLTEADQIKFEIVDELIVEPDTK